MIRVLSDWVRTLAVGSIFCAAILLLLPEGKGKREVKLACAAMLTILLIRPLRELNADQLTSLWEMQGSRQDNLIEDTDELSMELLSGIIREETEEYIWDAARRLGIARLGIRLQLKTDGELPRPWSVDLTGEVTEQEKELLSLLLEGELGIPEERQSWSMGDAD